jgi:hypothetical protein
MTIFRIVNATATGVVHVRHCGSVPERSPNCAVERGRRHITTSPPRGQPTVRRRRLPNGFRPAISRLTAGREWETEVVARLGMLAPVEPAGNPWRFVSGDAESLSSVPVGVRRLPARLGRPAGLSARRVTCRRTTGTDPTRRRDPPVPGTTWCRPATAPAVRVTNPCSWAGCERADPAGSSGPRPDFGYRGRWLRGLSRTGAADGFGSGRRAAPTGRESRGGRVDAAETID